MSTREEVFDQLDAYAGRRKSEIEEKYTTEGLVTSYLIEAHQDEDNGSINTSAFTKRGCSLEELDDGFYFLRNGEGMDIGFIEPMHDRYIFLHSTQKTQPVDNEIKRILKISPSLDATWLSGEYLKKVWDRRVLGEYPNRITQMKFSYKSYFEGSENGEGEPESARIREKPSLGGSIKESSKSIGEFLPDIQEAHSPFRAVDMIRFPAAQSSGSYDFYGWGKLTHRSSSFRVGRTLVSNIVKNYKQITEKIEEKIWFSVKEDGIGGVSVEGAPLTISLNNKMSEKQFHTFIDKTFEKNYGPFRVWGNPIEVGENRYHVYGLDQHMWEDIRLDLRPSLIKAILPRGTCGNTVHRLVSNVQKYISPSIKCYVGDENYFDIVDKGMVQNN